METTMINDSVLSNDDRYYPETNCELEHGMGEEERASNENNVLSDQDLDNLVWNFAEWDGGEEDPQAQAVYTVESNITDLDSPVWTRGEVLSSVRSMADALGRHPKPAIDRHLKTGQRRGCPGR